MDDFKRSAKQQIKAILERDRDPLSGEWIIAYLRPLGSDPTSKGSRKVCTRSHGLCPLGSLMPRPVPVCCHT